MELEEIIRRLGPKGTGLRAALAKHLGLDASSLTKTLSGERTMKADELRQTMAFFAKPENTLEFARQPGQVIRVGEGRRIPVYGYAAADTGDQIVFNEGGVIDTIEPPPFWSGPGELFAVRVVGASMEPRLFQGELAVAQRGLEPARNQDVVAELGGGHAIIKTYSGARQGRLWFHQWNPDKPLDYAAGEIKAMHAVIWRR